jgi:hypothetical protein
VNKDYIGLELPKVLILEQDVFGITVVAGFVEFRTDSIGQEKQLQYASDFG